MSDEERFEQAIEKLLADRSPRADASRLPADERDMLQMAQLLRGTQRQPPRPEFVEQLHERLFAPPRRLTRRAAFFSGLGAMAAGLLGGFGIDRAVNSSSSTPSAGWKYQIVPPGKGRWIPVAKTADLPPGSVQAFAAGSVQGFLINDAGKIRAMSRICTHMGCALSYEQARRRLLCPCHGAEFSMAGEVVKYPIPLRELPRIEVRENGQVIEAYGV